MVSAQVQDTDDLPMLSVCSSISISLFWDDGAHQSLPVITWGGERISFHRGERLVTLSNTQLWKDGGVGSGVLHTSSLNLV